MADQGLDQQPQPQSQTTQQQQQDSSFKSESENEDPNPALDSIQSSRLIHQSSLQEPLKVPIPPSSQFRRSDSNSRFVRILYSLVVHLIILSSKILLQQSDNQDPIDNGNNGKKVSKVFYFPFLGLC